MNTINKLNLSMPNVTLNDGEDTVVIPYELAEFLETARWYTSAQTERLHVHRMRAGLCVRALDTTAEISAMLLWDGPQEFLAVLRAAMEESMTDYLSGR